MLFWLAAWVALPAAAEVEDYAEGIDYQLVPTHAAADSSGKVEVAEFFWYGCPHCWSLEPYLEAWVATLPPDVEFKRIPAAFNERWALHARAYYALEAMGAIDRVHRPLFKAIHEEKRQLFDRDSLADFVAEHGVDRESFLSTMDSFAVAGQVSRASLLVKRYRIDSVPTLVIDGKYKSGPSIAEGNRRLLDIASFLLQQELDKRSAAGEPLAAGP
jgi:thiol:disulfide interchange protein DsbA